MVVSAVRELSLEAHAQGLNPRKVYKLHNLMLAALDLDSQVARQRLIGDHVAWSADRVTIYTSPADRAIGWANLLFASPKGRIGNLEVDKLSDEGKAALDGGNANIAIINFMPSTDKSDSNADKYGHSYFRNAPTVSSDVILMLRDDLDPGGRDAHWRVLATNSGGCHRVIQSRRRGVGVQVERL